MNEQILTTSCACGWTITGPEDKVVAATVDHGQRIHNMAATPEQVMAQAVRTEPGASADGTEAPDG